MISVVWLQGGTAEDIICWTIYWCFWLSLFLWTWITQMLNLQVIKSGKCKERKPKNWENKQNCCHQSHIQEGFRSYFCRHAISKLSWDDTRKHFEGKLLLFFVWQGLFHFLMFQLPRTEPSHIGLKSNFRHHDNCTNVWRQMLEEKRGRWGQIRGWKTPWWQRWSREVNPAV